MIKWICIIVACLLFVTLIWYGSPWNCNTHELSEDRFITQCSFDPENRWKF